MQLEKLAMNADGPSAGKCKMRWSHVYLGGNSNEPAVASKLDTPDSLTRHVCTSTFHLILLPKDASTLRESVCLAVMLYARLMDERAKVGEWDMMSARDK
jgi:hypothetical protein